MREKASLCAACILLIRHTMWHATRSHSCLTWLLLWATGAVHNGSIQGVRRVVQHAQRPEGLLQPGVRQPNPAGAVGNQSPVHHCRLTWQRAHHPHAAGVAGDRVHLRRPRLMQRWGVGRSRRLKCVGSCGMLNFSTVEILQCSELADERSP